MDVCSNFAAPSGCVRLDALGMCVQCGGDRHDHLHVAAPLPCALGYESVAPVPARLPQANEIGATDL